MELKNVDYSYFINSSDKFSAKKLPSPKSSCVKFKDVTDLYDLREEIKDYKPITPEEFQELYENCFDSIYSYDIEIDTFEDTILANRQKFLGTNTWIKKYWYDLLEVVEGFDTGSIEIDDEWLVTEDALAKVLLKAGVAEQKVNLEYDDWINSLQGNKLAELKEIAKPLGIKLSQRKDALIHDLITYEETTKGTLPVPTVIRVLPQLEVTLVELEERYISELSSSLNNFEYPRPFEAAIWSEVAAEHTGLIKTLADEKLIEFDDLNETIPEITEQELLAAEKLVKDMGIEFNVSINSSEVEQSKDERIEDYFDNGFTRKLENSTVLIFDYEDSQGNISSREIRLDQLNETDGTTYLKGFCYMRNAARTFRLDRVQGKIIVKETGELINKNHIRDLTDLKPPKTMSNQIKAEIPPNTSNNTPITKPELKRDSITKETGNGTGWKAVGWVFGVTYLLSTIDKIQKGEWMIAILFIIAGSLITPPINKALAKILNEKGLMQRFTIAKGFIGWFVVAVIAGMFTVK